MIYSYLAYSMQFYALLFYDVMASVFFYKAILQILSYKSYFFAAYNLYFVFNNMLSTEKVGDPH